MAQLPQVANSESNNEGIGDRSPLEAGDYIVCVTKSEFKKTKAGTGHYLNLTLVVAEGDRKGSVLWTLLNLDNPNPIAVEIATKELNSICQACGLASVEDSDELHGIPFGITVVIKPGNSDYPPSNDIKNYKPADEVGVAEGIESAPPETSNNTESTKPSSEKKDKLPWEK